MEPRPFSRGDLSRAFALLGSCRRFNGAATFQSRRPVSVAVKQAVDTLLQWSRDLSVAETLRHRSHRYFHRRFNGAATFQSRRPRRQREELGSTNLASMEPRPFSRGDSSIHALVMSARKASMEPRPFSRGDNEGSPYENIRLPGFNGAATFQSRRLAVETSGSSVYNPASMEPRPFSRGDMGAAAWATRLFRLQWSRDLSVAETAVAGGDPTLALRLQWSRDLSVAETPEA